VTLAFWVILTLLMKEIVNLHIGSIYLIGPEYAGCEPMIPWILLGYVFQGINLIFLPGIYFEKKTRYMAYNTILAATVNIVANFLLIPVWGIVGSAIAATIGYITQATSTHYISQKLYKIPYDYPRFFLIIGLAMAFGFSNYVSHFSLSIRLTLIITFPLMLGLFRFFKKEEFNSLKSLFPF